MDFVARAFRRAFLASLASFDIQGSNPHAGLLSGLRAGDLVFRVGQAAQFVEEDLAFEFVRRVRRRGEKPLNTGNAVRLKNIIGILQAALLAEHAGRALRHQDFDALPHQAGDATPQAVIGVRASRIPIADNDDFLDTYGQPGLANGRDTKCRDNRLRHGHADAQGILRAFREVEARVLIVAEADEPSAGPIVWATMLMRAAMPEPADDFRPSDAM